MAGIELGNVTPISDECFFIRDFDSDFPQIARFYSRRSIRNDMVSVAAQKSSIL